MKQALEEATSPNVAVPHPHVDPHGMRDVLRQLGVRAENLAYSTGRAWGGEGGAARVIASPADGQRIAAVAQATVADYETVMRAAQAAFPAWRLVPAPGAATSCGRLARSCAATRKLWVSW